MLGIIRCRTLKCKPLSPETYQKGTGLFWSVYLGKRRRMPGGSGAARDPKAVVGSPGNTLWAKNAKYEYGCYLSIILPSQNNRHNSKICSLT